jgi:hypothetical protein
MGILKAAPAAARCDRQGAKKASQAHGFFLAIFECLAVSE